MNCPICNSKFIDHLTDTFWMPLSVLNIPDEPDNDATTHPVRVSHCRHCHHIFNSKYNPQFDQVFYGGCTMYNSGSDWQVHMMSIAKEVIECNRILQGPILEIGAGNGEFAKMVGSRNYIAYEPSEDFYECSKFVETRKMYFGPEELVKVKPSIIIMRHVLEHFADPRDFLESLSIASCRAAISPKLIIEVPCCLPALESGRLEDWVYEHPHHFNDYSMRQLLTLSGWFPQEIEFCYNDEVLYTTATPSYESTVNIGCDNVRNAFFDFKHLCQNLTRPLVFWGGAGKGANLINMFCPMGDVTVVDSDMRKWGKYVPGTDFKIMAPSLLRYLPPGDIIVTTNWRVEDITNEIKRTGIPFEKILSVVKGKLVQYNG